LQVRSEIQLQTKEDEEFHLLEKSRERERARVEFEEDITFKTKMGACKKNSWLKKLALKYTSSSCSQQ